MSIFQRHTIIKIVVLTPLSKVRTLFHADTNTVLQWANKFYIFTKWLTKDSNIDISITLWTHIQKASYEVGVEGSTSPPISQLICFLKIEMITNYSPTVSILKGNDRAFMVRSWGCDSPKSFHVVPMYTVQWKFIWRIFFLFVSHQRRKNPPNFIHKNTTMTYDLQNRGNLVKRRQNCMGVNCMDGQQTRPLVYAGSYTACCEGGGPWGVLSTKSTLRSWCNFL